MTSRKYSRRPLSGSKLFNVEEEPPPPTTTTTTTTALPKIINLRKEYVRFCKLYSSEPLDIVASPLEKASYGRDSIVVDLRGRGLRGVDCIAIGKILALDAPITQLILSDCLLLPQGFQALMDGLCKNTRLQVLELRGNNIQTTMVTTLSKFLKVNCHLRKLLLEWNCIGTSREHFHYICEAIRLNTGLQSLDLRNNQIGPECAIELASALSTNKYLKELDLRWNSIGLAGAKAIWEALRVNFTIIKIYLCGNYIPEDIVRCIEDCLKQKSEREGMMEEYSQRTTLLTRQLQKSEKQHQSEINTIVSVFDAEEADLKETIKESHQQILDMDNKIKNLTIKNHSISLKVEKLQTSLQCSNEKEDTLRKALEIKEEHTEHLESLFRVEMDKFKMSYESQLQLNEEELEKKKREIQVLTTKLSKVESQLDIKMNEINDCNERIEVIQKELLENRKVYEERIKAEKQKWNNWKDEVETAEKREIHMLEDEIKEIQNKMMEHIKIVEKGKIDAEEEIHHLKISFVTHKTEGEEELNKLRLKLKEDHEHILENYNTQTMTMKEQIEKQESEIQKQNSFIRKLESDNITFSRQNENLRQQISHMEIELNEKETNVHTSLARARNDVKEQMEQLGKEEEANKTLRSQVLELQEQIAKLTLRQNREVQEKFSEMDHWKTQVERREDELFRLKEEDMRRASLLHEAFLAYMRSTSAATGIPLPSSYYTSNPENNPINILTQTGKGDGPVRPPQVDIDK